MAEVFKKTTVAVFYKQLHFSLVHMNDMAGEAETKQTLQNKIGNIENFCYISGMRLNVDKKWYLEMEGILDITTLGTFRYNKSK